MSGVFWLQLAANLILLIIAVYVVHHLLQKRKTEQEESQRKYADTIRQIADVSQIKENLEREKQDLKLEMAYEAGRKTGEKETMGKFKITIQPFSSINNGVFKKRSTAGYIITTHFDHFKIGEPTRVIILDKKTVDREMIQSTLMTVEKLAETFSGAGFVTELIKEVPKLASKNTSTTEN